MNKTCNPTKTQIDINVNAKPILSLKKRVFSHVKMKTAELLHFSGISSIQGETVIHHLVPSSATWNASEGG